MNLSAVSIGYAVPQTDFKGTVHSVFQSAVNLQLENDGELLTIVVNGRTDLPQGIRISAPKTFSFEEIQTGEIVTCRGRILRFESFELEIDLRNAEIWKCDLPSLMVNMTNPDTATAWRNVWKVLGKGSEVLVNKFIVTDLIFSDEKVRIGRLQKVEEAILNLIESTQRFDLTDTKVLETLIGLGTGLTPSYDDFLVGYLGGLWCTVRGRGERTQFISDLGKAVRQHSSRTNDISRTYLLHAAYGQVSSLLFDLAESICQGEKSDNLIDKAEAAIQVGHVSGKASVAGLLVGLAAWDGDQLLYEAVISETKVSLEN
jgi:hypothetical protein